MERQRSEPAPSRPDMPASYGLQPTSTAGQANWSEARDKIVLARNYWVATTGPHGQPHSVPVWGVWLDESFVFATDRASRKGRNLAANPALVVHLESGDDVVILEGIVEEPAETPLLDRFVETYEAKYQFRPDPGNPEQVVYRLRPRMALTWLEKDFPGTAIRWSFDAD